MDTNNNINFYNVACFYSLQNNLKKSLYFLDKAIKKGFKSYENILRDPDLKNLRVATNFRNYFYQVTNQN